MDPVDYSPILQLVWVEREHYSSSGCYRSSHQNFHKDSPRSFKGVGRFGPHWQSRFGNVVWSVASGRWFQW